MSSDFRMLQHDAAMATHSLTGAIEQLRELYRQHPKIVAAEYWDIRSARLAIVDLLSRIERETAVA